MSDLDLPDEVAEAIAAHDETDAVRLRALEQALVTKRGEAVSARKESGIEDIWLAAEEAYLGIDDANRSSFAGARWAKPTNMTGPLTSDQRRTAADGETKSTAFVRITSRYVDAGAAKLSEILLPADEKAFSFSSTPVPELITALKDTSQAVVDGVPLERDARPGEAQQLPGAALPPTGGLPLAPTAGALPAAPGSGPGIPITVQDLAQEKQEHANTAAKKAEKRIHDWMVESRFRAEGRKIVFDASRIGVGVLKGPFPRTQISRARENGKLKINKKVVPGYEWADPWNIYPDPACGENIQNGDHLFHAEPIGKKQLRKLKGLKGYIDGAIDRVLSDGPAGVAVDNQKPNAKHNRHLFTAWHYYGTLTHEEVLATRTVDEGDLPLAGDVYVICTMVNDTLIRATINPLDSGEIPYHAVPWQRRPGHWAGVGVGEQIAMPQAAINAATRACFNNAGKSAGSVIVADRGAITPADGSWTLTPDKLYYKSADATADDVRKAFAFFQVPNTTPQLMVIIELCMRFAEEVTNIPLITQGQSGKTTPETFGATQLQNNNANQLLRSIGYAFDDYITEPVVNQSYEYLLLDPDIPEDEKGDWKIDAHGSVALVERAIQDQTVSQMGEFAINPAFGVDPKRWFAEFSKTKHLNPRTFQYTPEEQARIDAAPKPAAPAIEVAKIKSADAKLARELDKVLAAQAAQLEKVVADGANATKTAIAEMRKEVDELRVKKDTDRDTIYARAETERTQVEHRARMAELEIRERIAMLDYANKRQLKLDDVKKDLAKTAMTLEAQERMQAREQGAQVAEAAAEPAGKAPNGKGFTA
ncbi:MAG: hypothetical protein Q8R92_13890 [Deltaproteobacteria bacterium]|nr:hypothetical protein [Deltaproteobacteria bacterium]